MEEDFNIRNQQLTSKERDFENALRPLSFDRIKSWRISVFL